MNPLDPQDLPQPEWNDGESFGHAIAALRRAHDESSALEAVDQFLWMVGNNETGSFYPVVLASLSPLQQLLQEGGDWAQQAVLESLIDLGGTFVPEPGQETHQGSPVKATLLAFIQSLRPQVTALASTGHPKARSAADLLELIDDLAA